MTLQLQAPSLAATISSLASPLTRSTRRFVIRAQGPLCHPCVILTQSNGWKTSKQIQASKIQAENPDLDFYVGVTCIGVAVEPTEKSVEIMRKFSEQYARKSGTYFCVDKGVTSVVIKGLADHKDSLGAPLCPCRHYDDKQAEAGQGFWNCPCVPMRERKECHCMLFLTPENDFAGKEQTITLEEIRESTANM